MYTGWQLPCCEIQNYNPVSSHAQRVCFITPAENGPEKWAPPFLHPRRRKPKIDSTALGARPLTMIEAFLSFLGLNRREPPPPPPTICRLAGCERKCYEERGRIHDFCRKSHADMHHSALQASNRHNGAGYRRSAPLPRFDATREYVSGDLVLFWQPPSVFSQWTPSPFVVEEVRPHRLSPARLKTWCIEHVRTRVCLDLREFSRAVCSQLCREQPVTYSTVQSLDYCRRLMYQRLDTRPKPDLCITCSRRVDLGAIWRRHLGIKRKKSSCRLY